MAAQTEDQLGSLNIMDAIYLYHDKGIIPSWIKEKKDLHKLTGLTPDWLIRAYMMDGDIRKYYCIWEMIEHTEGNFFFDSSKFNGQRRLLYEHAFNAVKSLYGTYYDKLAEKHATESERPQKKLKPNNSYKFIEAMYLILNNNTEFINWIQNELNLNNLSEVTYDLLIEAYMLAGEVRRYLCVWQVVKLAHGNFYRDASKHQHYINDYLQAFDAIKTIKESLDTVAGSQVLDPANDYSSTSILNLANLEIKQAVQLLLDCDLTIFEWIKEKTNLASLTGVTFEYLIEAYMMGGPVRNTFCVLEVVKIAQDRLIRDPSRILRKDADAYNDAYNALGTLANIAIEQQYLPEDRLENPIRLEDAFDNSGSVPFESVVKLLLDGDAVTTIWVKQKENLSFISGITYERLIRAYMIDGVVRKALCVPEVVRLAEGKLKRNLTGENDWEAYEAAFGAIFKLHNKK